MKRPIPTPVIGHLMCKISDFWAISLPLLRHVNVEHTVFTLWYTGD